MKIDDETGCRIDEDEVVNQVMYKCIVCNTNIILAIQSSAKCSVCGTIYNTLEQPVVKLVQRGDPSVGN